MTWLSCDILILIFLLFLGQLLHISNSYSGRLSVAYKTGRSFTRPQDPDSKYVNLSIAIYECESTGGESNYSLQFFKIFTLLLIEA